VQAQDSYLPPILEPPPADTPPRTNGDLAPAPPSDAPTALIPGPDVYTPGDFAQYAPRTALDMLRNVPGFSIDGGGGGGGFPGGGGGQQRGLGQASGNVLVNGERLVSKSTGIGDQLTRIAANDVIRIEIVDGATLNIPGLSGRVANVIARGTGGVSGRFEWRPQASTGPAPIRWTQGDASMTGTNGPVAWTLSLLRGRFGRSQTGRRHCIIMIGVVAWSGSASRSPGSPGGRRRRLPARRGSAPRSRHTGVMRAWSGRPRRCVPRPRCFSRWSRPRRP
jgi:hypothetical protein